ncbi:MAG: transposase [Clostridiales bacterium]|nr:transposase [Clostridiales bacterium]
MITKLPKQIFTYEFKNQMAQRYLNGKTKAAILKEYDLKPSVFVN